MRATKLLGLAAFAMLALFACISFADLSVANITVLPETVRPGISGVISMTVSNPDTSSARNVIVEGFGSSNVYSAGKINLGDFKTGVSTSASLPFSVSPSTKAGVYTLSYTFAWNNDTGTGYKTLLVPITVKNPAIFSLTSQGGAVYTEGDFSIPVHMSNSGGASRNVRISINSTQFFQNGANPLVVSDIGRNEGKNFTLGITLSPSVASGTYSVPLVITYDDEGGSEIVATSSIRVLVKRKLAQFSLRLVQDGNLYPGKNVPLTLELENTGDEAAYSVHVGLANSTILTPLGASDLSIDDMPAGAKKTFKLDVGVNDVSPGFYRPTLLVMYKNSNGEVQSIQSVPLGLNINALSQLNVFVSAKPAPLTSSSQHTLSVLVSNIGTSQIKALTVRFEPNPSFKLLEAQDEQFIGGLSQDDFSTVQFKVLVADLPDGVYPINITSYFKDSYNKEHTMTVPVDLKVLSKQSAQKLTANGGEIPLPMLLIGGLVALAVLYFAYKRFFAKKPKQ